MKAEPNTTDKMAALYMVERQRGDDLEQLNDDLYAAARAVLSNWSNSGLAQAVRLLQTAVDAVDNHHDEVAAIKAGWDRQNELWVRLLSPRESCDPEIDPTKLWLEGKVLHAENATVALEQDQFRDDRAMGGH